jgi:hypothetical protein
VEKASNTTRGEVEMVWQFLKMSLVERTDTSFRRRTSFATFSMPLIREKVPYRFSFSSTCIMTLPTKAGSCRGPDHMGPATLGIAVFKKVQFKRNFVDLHAGKSHILGICLKPMDQLVS